MGERPVGFVPDGFVPDAPAASKPEDSGGVSGFAREFWKRTNPLETIKGLVHAAGDIPGTVKHLITADPAFLTQAEEAAKKGDYATALRKVFSFASMGMGHELDNQADMLQAGKYAEGAGAMAGNAANLLVPEAAGRVLGGARVPAVAAQADPAVAQAVAAGRAAGVPIDAATATGNPFVKFAQKTADESLVGSVVGGRARAAQQQGLATMGEQIAAKANRVPVTAGQAGEAAQAGVQATKDTAAAAATAHYEALRAIEATHPMPVDLTGVKAALEPVYATMARGADIAPLQGAKAGAVRALARILEGPDIESASVVDSALSDLKALQRATADTPGSAAANKAVDAVGRAVTQAVTKAGPEAVKALTEGRNATIAKYAADDVLNVLQAGQGEPVGAFTRMTRAGDAGAQHLRDVLKQAPETKPQIGRAVLDGLIDSATAGPDASFTAWNKLGPETKNLLYTPEHIKAVDDFLLLRKKIAENPNPSGSGLTVLKGGELVMHNPELTLGLPALSALLHSEAGVKLLTQGFRLPSASTVARSAWAAQLAKVAQQAGTPLTAGGRPQ